MSADAMQVDVVLMRSRGTKVPREQLLACAPIRGELGIFPRYDHWSRKRVPMACLLVREWKNCCRCWIRCVS
jgi:hypothetical protein